MMINFIRQFKLNKNINFKFLLLFSICQFTIIFEGYEILGYIFYYFLPLVTIFLNYNILFDFIKLLFTRKNIILLSSFAMFFLFSILFPIIYKTNDFSCFFNEPFGLMKQMIIQIYLIIIYVKYVASEIDIDEYLHYYILSCVLYVFGTIIMLVFPSVKEFFYLHLKDNDHAKNAALQIDYITRYGWSGFSNFEHSLKCTISVAFCSFLLLNQKYYKKAIYFVLLFLSLLGNLFYARIGIVASGFIVFLLLLYYILNNRKLAVILIVTSITIFITILILSLFNSSIKNWTNWIFTNFISVFNGGSFFTGSLGIVFDDMLFFPGIKTFFLGDGLYTVNGKYYLGTDLGFMRTILFGGMPYLFVRYGCFITLIKRTWEDKGIKTSLALFLLIAFLIGEIKGEIIITFLSICIPIFLLNNLKAIEKNN